MPDYGDPQYPYPNASDVPDGPAAFLSLVQRAALINGAGIASTANATTRAALVTNGDAFAGLVVLQVDTLEFWLYDGTDWLPFPRNPHGEYTYSRASVASGTSATLNAAPTLAASTSSTDVADFYTPHTTGLTFVNAGVYLLGVSALWDGTLATARSYIQLTIGAIAYRIGWMSGEDRMAGTWSGHIAAATTVAVAVVQTTGATKTVTGRIHATRVSRL